MQTDVETDENWIFPAVIIYLPTGPKNGGGERQKGGGEKEKGKKKEKEEKEFHARSDKELLQLYIIVKGKDTGN